jgi:hypothetical protein
VVSAITSFDSVLLEGMTAPVMSTRPL